VIKQSLSDDVKSWRVSWPPFSINTYCLLATIINILFTCKICSLPTPKVSYHYVIRLWLEVQDIIIRSYSGGDEAFWVWFSGSPLVWFPLIQRLVNCKKLPATFPCPLPPNTQWLGQGRIITKDTLIPNGEQWEICRSYWFIRNLKSCQAHMQPVKLPLLWGQGMFVS